MPPVKQQDPPKGEQKEKAEATPEPARHVPQKGEHNPAVNDLLAYAQDLRDEKEDLFARVEANRVVLRNYKTMGLLSDKQGESIDQFYPKPKRAGKTDDNGADKADDKATTTPEPAKAA